MAFDIDARNVTIGRDTDPKALRESEIRGFDALDLGSSTPPQAHAVWRSAWPKLAALALALGLWQLITISGWRESYVLPGPAPVFLVLADRVATGEFWKAVGVTMTRGIVGFAIAAVLGLVLGVLVARSRILRAAIGSLITGLQTMPSIAWFPLAILLFQLSEQAILFVILIGAVPSIANGVIGGVDYVPALLVRAGRNVGAAFTARRRTLGLDRQPAQSRPVPEPKPRAERHVVHDRSHDRDPDDRHRRRRRLLHHRAWHPPTSRRGRRWLTVLPGVHLR